MNQIIEKATSISKQSQISDMALSGTAGLKREKLALKVKDNFELIYPGAKVIYMSEVGSGLHGTSKEHYEMSSNLKLDNKTSDFDVKAIYLPSLSSIIGGDLWSQKTVLVASERDGKNGEDDIDITFIPLNQFFEKLSKNMEANAVELLFSMFSKDTVIFETSVSKSIKLNFDKFIFDKTEALTRFAVSMASKYSLKGERINELDKFYSILENKAKAMTKNEKKYKKVSDLKITDDLKNFKYISRIQIEHRGKLNTYYDVLTSKFIDTLKVEDFLKKVRYIRNSFGKRAEIAAKEEEIDYKAYSHAFRALSQALELVKTGRLTFPLKNAKELMEIKYNGASFSRCELSEMLEQLEIDLMRSTQDSVLNPESDSDFISKFKVNAYGLEER